MRRLVAASLLVGLVAAAAPLAASASTLTVTGGGLVSESANFACSGSPCLANRTFDLLLPGLATGVIEVDALAGTASIALQVASVSFDGAYAGIDEIRFTDLVYRAVVSVSVTGGSLTGGGQLGTVTGSYEQWSDGALVVGPTAFSESASFLALSCSLPGGAGICAFQVGTGTAGQLDLDVGGAGPNRFVHAFNVAVVPEPGALLLYGVGCLLASGALRVARAGHCGA